MNVTISQNSFASLRHAYGPNPGLCFASDGSSTASVAHAVYQNISNLFFKNKPENYGAQTSSDLKTRAKQPQSNLYSRQAEQLLSSAKPNQESFDGSERSQLDTFLASLLRDFHLKTHLVQNKILSSIDCLYALFLDCRSSNSKPKCKSTFEKKLSNLKELASDQAKKDSSLSKLLSNFAPISEDTLLHILGDSFGLNTGYEGYWAHDAANYLITFLSFKLIDDPQNNQIKKARDILIETLEFSSNFYNPVEGNLCEQSLVDLFLPIAPCFSPRQLSRIQRPSQVLRKKLEEIEEEKPVYLFGGWAGSSTSIGHAIMYKFVKQKDSDFYTFEIINMGLGIKYHLQHYEKGVRKVIPFRGKKNIPIDSLTSDTFVSALHEMRTSILTYDSAANSPREWTPNQLYTVLSDSILEGELYSDHITASDWVEPQHSGTCGYRSLIEIFGKEMAPAERARFEIELRIWSFKNYLSSINLETIDPSKLDFLLKSIYAYSTVLTNYLKLYPNLLTSSELKEIRLYLEFAQKVVGLFDHQLKIDLNRKNASLSSLERLKPLTIKSNIVYYESWDSKKFKKSPKFKLQTHLEQISIDNLPQTLPQIVNELKYLFDHQLTDYVIQSIQALTQKIHPMDLSKLSPKEKEKALELLFDTSELLYMSSIENKQGYLMMPEKYLSMLKISDLISRLITKKQMKALGFDSLSFLFMGFEKTASPSFFFLRPETLIEYEKIKKDLQVRGFSFREIPRLFESYQFSTQAGIIENSRIVVDKVFDPEGEITLSFFRDVFIKSISRQLRKRFTIFSSWVQLGDFLKDHQEKLFDVSSPTYPLTPFWKRLINHALMMERFSSHYLTKPNQATDQTKLTLLERLLIQFNLKVEFSSLISHQYTIDLTSFLSKGLYGDWNEFQAVKDLSDRSSYYPFLSSLLFKQNSNIKYKRNDKDSSSHVSLVGMELDAAKAVFPKHIFNSQFKAQSHHSGLYKSTQFHHALGDELCQIPKYGRLRIERALSFFDNPMNMAKVDELESYMMLVIFLTSDKILLEELSRDTDGPLLGKKLALFLQKKFERALLKENIKLAALISSLNQTMASFYALAQPELESPFESIDFVAKIQPLLTSVATSDLDLAFAYGQFYISRFHKGLKSESDAVELVGYYLKYKSVTDNIEKSENFKDQTKHQFNLQHLSIQHALFQSTPILRQLIEENPTLIPKAIQTVYQTSSITDKWEIDPEAGFPVYICEEKQLSLDLLNGVLTSTKGEVLTGLLPKSILSDQLFQSLFGNQQFEAKKIGPATFEFEDHQSNTYQVILENNYLQNSRIFIKLIAKGKEFFLLDSRSLTHSYNYQRLHIPNLNLFKKYHGWISKDGYMIFTDPPTQKQIFYYDPLSSKGVVHLETGESLVSLHDTNLVFLSGFENPHFIDILASECSSLPQKATVNSIEFPRLLFENKEVLRFERTSSKLRCNKFPNLFLSSHKGPFYQAVDPVVILEDLNNKPALALMVPYFFSEDIKAERKRSLKTTTPLDTKEGEHEKRFQLLEYELIENPNYKIEPYQPQYLFNPRSREGALYLAYSYLRLHEYQKAVETLLPFKSSIDKFNDAELEAASGILEANVFNQDQSPLAYSVSTLLAYLLFNQSEDNELPSELALQAIRNYIKYLELDNFNNLQVLNPYEELLLIESLECLKKESPSIEGRYKYLSEVIDFQPVNMPSSINILFPDTFSFRASVYNIVQFTQKIKKQSLGEYKKNALKDVSKNFFYSIPFVESLFNIDRSKTSAHYFPSSFYFPEFFSTLYQIAKTNESSQNPTSFNLKKYILFLKNFSEESQEQIKGIMRGFADLLWLVMHRPDMFPSTKEFNFLLNYNKEDLDKVSKLVSDIEQSARSLIGQVGSEILINSSFESLDPITPPSKEVYEKFAHTEENPHPLPLTNLKSENEKELDAIFNLRNFSSANSRLLASNQEIKKMLQVFSSRLPDSYDQTAFDQVKKDCEKYLSKPKEVATSFSSSVDMAIITKAQEETSLLISKQKRLVAKLKKELLQLANKKSENPIVEETNELNRIAKKTPKVSLSSLLVIFQRQSFCEYSKANCALSPTDIEQLNIKVAQYLVEANFLQKLQRIDKSLQKYLSDILEHVPHPSAFQKLSDIASSQRCYDIAQNPSYLVYEHLADIQLYPEQVEKLKELTVAIDNQSSPEKIGLITEAIMGFGKSIVMLPLLSLHISNLGRLPLIVMPDSLIESLGSEILSRVQPLKQVNVIKLDRGSRYNLEELQILYVKLKQALKNRNILIFSSKSLQVLFLKYIEFLNSTHPTNARDPKIISVFQEIFKILKQSAIPIFDEVDILFNCRHETHFSLNNPMPLQDSHLMTSSLVYQLILENAEEIPFNLDFTPFNPEKKSLTPSRYHKELKPYLVEKLFKRLQSGSVFKSLEIKSWVDQLENKSLLTSYLMGSQSKELEEFIEGIQNEKIANIIALAQAQLNLFLPMTANKKLLEHYGPAISNGRIYAIPYQHGKASEKSEFGNPYETINYSIQTYLEQGIPREMTDKELKVLSSELFQISTQLPGLNLEQIETFKKMLSIYPHLKNFHLKENTLKEANEYVNKSPLQKLKFIENFILPTIKTYTQRISSNAQTFKILFNKMIGFTGTMWNSETYPEGLNVTPAEGIMGNTLTQFVIKSQGEVQVIEKEEDSFTHLNSWIQGPNTKAWIDLSGHFDFIPRLDVVKKILSVKRPQGIMGVAFYDVDNELKVLHELDEPPVPFALSPLKDQPDKRFTLYDHQRTTGANVAQAGEARAIITIGKHLTLRDLAQAAWRMRGLDKNQAVDFITTAADRQAILALLNLPENHTLKVMDIIQYAILNQQHKKAADNLLSQKQKFIAVLQEHVFKLLMDQNKTADEIYDIFLKFEKIFIQDIIDNPKKQFGYPETIQETEKILRNFIEHLTFIYAHLFGDHWDEILKKMEDIISLEIMPQKMPARKPLATVELEQNVEVKLKQENETENETETERELEENYRIRHKGTFCSPPAIVNWKKNVFALFPHSFDLEALLEGEVTALRRGFKSFEELEQSENLSQIEKDAIETSKALPYQHYQPEAKTFFSSDILIQKDLITFRSVFQEEVVNGLCTERCKEVLCVETSRGLKMLMVSGQSAADWKEYIQTCDDQNVPPTKKATFLVNLDTESLELPNDPKLLSQAYKIIESKEFKVLKIQAKILSGAIFFNYDEIKLLSEWIKENKIDKDKLRQFILDHTISHYPDRVLNFKASSLHHLLQKDKALSIKV